MFERTVTEDDLARLKAERDEANRAYTEALTLLDASKRPAPPVVPAPPPPPDDRALGRLGDLQDILADAPGMPGGWRGAIAETAWRLVAPALERQQAFNAALVDHLARNLEVQRETRRAIETTIQLAREQFEALVTFEWHLMAFLQKVTPYVDGADREAAALQRRATEDNAFLLDVYNERLNQRAQTLEDQLRAFDDRLRLVDGFAAGLSGVSDELQKRWESMVAREVRLEARLSSLPVLQQAVQSLRRELERLGAAPVVQAPMAAEAPGPPSGTTPGRAPAAAQAFGTLDSYKYVCFEDTFRGSQDEIAARVADYLPLFEGASDVLDVGCGRGEFLDLLREHGISGRGLDINHEMVEVCRARGLAADEGDALAYLNGLADGSLGGLFAAQVVEHLRPDYLVRLLDVAYHKLRPGSIVVLETINPSCWYAFFESYLRDITHVQPVHPDTLKYLLLASGFQQAEIRFRAPYPEEEKLQPAPAGAGEAAGGLAAAFNANVEKINRLLFSYLDYAAVARRL